MGFRIEAPKQDGNARFNSLKVNLNENNSATRTVVADEQGNFYYGAGGTGGASGTSGTSGANGAPGTNGANGSSGTSGTGFNAIADPLQGRVLLSDGSTNSASASANLFYETGSSVFQVTGSVNITGSLTGSTDIIIRNDTSEPITIGRAYYSASNGNNLVFGHGALRSGSTGTNRNIAIGDYALATINSGIENVALGYGALYYAVNNRNTAVGAYALFYTTGSTGFRNNAFGAYALAFNTTGEVNSAFGSYALYANVIGSYNAGMGDFSLRFLSTGSSNSALGQAAGVNLRSGEGNVFVGRGAAPSLLSGSNNTILGAITPNADINTPIFGLATGSYNTIIGSNIKYLSSILNNNIILADGEGNIKYRWDNTQNNLYGNTVVSGSLIGTSSVLFPSLTESPQSNVVLIDTTTGQLYYTGSTSFNTVSSSYPIAVTGSTLYSVNPNAGNNFNTAQNIFLGEGSGQDSQYTTFAVSLGYQAGYQSNFSESYNDNLGDFTASANYIGFQAGYQATQSTDANFIGFRAGYQSQISNGANFIGDSAGYLSKNGDNSNFIGRFAGEFSDSIRYSNVIGRSAGESGLNILDSNLIGENAGDSAKNIVSSNFIGYQAGLQSSSSLNSNFIGTGVGIDATSSYSTLIGFKAGANASRIDSIGSNNIIIGTNITLEKDRKDSINLGAIIFGTGSYFNEFGNPYSGSVNGRIGINQPNPQYTLDVSGSLNTVLDARINGLNVGRGGGNSVTNLSIGQSALLSNTTGLAHIAIGTLALYSASAGSNNNIAIGYTTQYNTTSGYSNVVVGKSGLFYNTIGAVNTAMGNNVMTDNVSGYGNNAFGDGALRTNTIGNENAAFGTHAGRYITGGANPNRSGSNSIFLGSYTKPLADGQTNQIVIGYGSVGLGSNTTVLGNSSTITTWLAGKVLIGTNETSSYQLRVVGSTEISGSLTTTGSILFPGLTESSQSSVVLIDTTTGQLYYTASSAIVVTSSISASYAPNIYNSNGILTSDRTVNLSTYTLNFSKSITITGVTVGTGPANSSTNSVLGFQALNFNTSSIGTVAIGYQAGLVASGSSRSVYIGYRTLYEAFAGKTGFQNVYVGGEAGRGANTNYAVFLGAVAGYFTSGSYSVHIGHYAGWQTNGSYNVILGANSAGGLSSGDYNTIIGSQVSGLSNISNNIILADGQGNIKYRWDTVQNNLYGNTVVSGSLLPSATEVFDLGSSTNKWKDLYLSGSTIYLGNIQLKEIDGNFVVSSLSGNPGFSGSFSGSLFGTSSWATNSITASSADDFLVRGTLTAQTIVAQVITSSVQYITGSTQFGSLLSNTHQFTGSVSITGSLGLDNTSPSTILTVGNTSKDNGGITVLSTDSSANYDILTGQRLYPRIRLIDSNPGGGSTFQIWNLGNQLRFGTNGGNSSISAFNINAGDAASVIFNGDIGIKQPSPSYTLDVTGTIRATGDVIAYSDARVKDNVETIENALEKVNALRGVSYTRKDTDDKSRKLGVIAQELLPIIPEAVSKDQHGNYSVSYGNMVGLLIEAIKEQQKQIDELKDLLKDKI